LVTRWEALLLNWGSWSQRSGLPRSFPPNNQGPFQEQVGALLKLSITSAPGERQSTSSNARSVTGGSEPILAAPYANIAG